MEPEKIDELCAIITRNFPQIEVWVPILKKRIVQDKKFMQELEAWIKSQNQKLN
jgi:hypothetical protein